VDKNKAKLIEIVGKENVQDSPSVLEKYSQDCSFAPPLKPWFVVRPGNTQEVQKIVALANELALPLIPVSSGPPHFRGDTVPSSPGAVIINMSRMNSIIRIDRRNRMVMIEPGVTYVELQPELAKNDLKLGTPLLPRKSKSVIASLLEREPTLVPKFSFSLPEPLRCLEVVWGNGEVLMTGDAATYPTLKKQWEMGLAQVTAAGPGQVDYHRLVSSAQGSMGIITWASVRCEILPKVHRFFFIPAETLQPLIDCAYRLLRVRLGDEFFIVNNTNLAYILGDNSDKMEELRETLPAWTIIIGIAGRTLLPEEKVDFQEKDIREIARQFGLQLVSAVPGASDNQVMKAVLNPSSEPYWKLAYKGASQDIFFLTTVDKTPGFVSTIKSVADALDYPATNIGVYLQPQHQGVVCHCEFTMPYDPQKPGEVARIEQFLSRGSEAMMNQGAYFSRPYGLWADMVYNRDEGNTRMLKMVKDIFDPNHVLNPGKLCF
jgi:FAD/FMN-containing dehydrogenase